MTNQLRAPRSELITEIVDRDGLVCAHPDCKQAIDLNGVGKMETTIEHWYPQWWCKEQGWTIEQTWDLSNLKLAHKSCNAKKGDLVPNEDGTLPSKRQSSFRFRRQKRAERPEICESCQSGRLLGPDEWCNSCGSGPNPGRYPKWRQMSPKDCEHDLFYCVACTVWFPEYRRSVIDALITGGEGYE